MDLRATRDTLRALMRPAAVCVLGASATRFTRGNIAIRNMQALQFAGKILPVHPQAATVEGLPAIASIEDLPPGVDVAFVAVAAAAVCDVVSRLDRAGVRAAVVITAGFSPEQEAELRALTATSAVLVHGPNCMGLLNLSDALPLYSAEISARVRRGPVALLAQSGSAAIAMMNTLDIGFSKVVTVGSEFRLTAADYLDWLADDEATLSIGIILEAIQLPEAFAAAVRRVHAAGKSVVVLKVGRSAAGVLAAQAHTGALITPADAYACFFRDLGVPTVADYEQLAGALTALASCRPPPPGTGVAIAGISGGETALACDLAADLDLRLAEWSPDTEGAVRAALPGTTGRNPLDVGASVGHEETGGDLAALVAIAADDAVGIVVGLQDMQASLPRQLVDKYLHAVGVITKLRLVTAKPILMISPTPDAVHPELAAELAAAGVPVLRGLSAGLAAVRALAGATRGFSPAPWSVPMAPDILAALKAEIRHHDGVLPVPLCQRILSSYGIPLVRSVFVGVDGALPAEGAIEFPVVVKVSSIDIAHRSEIGGVRLGVSDIAALRAAIAAIRASVADAMPHAVIEGFEIQEEMSDCIEALAGFTAVPPFDALTIVGTGGTLAELAADRAVGLGQVGPEQAVAMIAGTRLGKLLGGYRNLIPRTDPDGLADLVSRLTRLGCDLSDVIVACDLNPVLVRPGSGEARVVDVLMIAQAS